MTGPEAARRPDFHEMVRDLTRVHQHREPYDATFGGTRFTAHHTTDVPALVMQLVGANPGGTLGQFGTTFGSRPAARIEALDTVMLIDDEAGEWLDRLGEVIPSDRIDPATQRTIRGSGTIASLRRLGGLHPGTPHCGAQKGRRDEGGRWCCTRHHLEHDVRHWWHQARIITGWDTAAYKPHNTCPICEAHDSLRVRVDVAAGRVDSALCVECREVWEDADQISLLSRHIRDENGDDAA